MKYFIVAICSFFDSEIKQFKINADTGYDAFKLAIIEFWKEEESKIEERNWQNSSDYPKTLEELSYTLCDTIFSVIEVKEF